MGSSQKLHCAQVGQFSTGGVGQFCIGTDSYRAGGISWPTLVVALGFPLYFMLRRHLHTAHTGGLWFDILLTFPVATYFAFAHGNGFQTFVQAPNLKAISVSKCKVSCHRK